jgi:dCTP diphosphatase
MSHGRHGGDKVLSEPLRQQLLAFRAEREWTQFHNLRTLSASICLEGAELLEITQWVPDADLERVVIERRTQIEEELADLAILIPYLSTDLAIDLERATGRKLEINRSKVPGRQSERVFGEIHRALKW